jgi:hypothetical protein
MVCLASRVPAVLLQGNSTDVYISYDISCLKAYHRPDHLTCRPIIDYYRQNYPSTQEHLSLQYHLQQGQRSQSRGPGQD